MAAVPEGWRYQVLYVEPEVLCDWSEHDGRPPRAARWVVFEDPALRRALLDAHAALATKGRGLAVEETVLSAVAALTPHLRGAIAFQTQVRVRRARRLLDDGIPPAAVAADCGFADQPHLNRVFKPCRCSPSRSSSSTSSWGTTGWGGSSAPAGGGGGGANFSGEPGLLRLFNGVMGGQASWLLPAALLALMAGLVATRRAPRTDRTRAGPRTWLRASDRDC